MALNAAPERTDLHSGTPYWLVRNGTDETYPVLATDIETEVVIIGGGITGALCAYHLCEAGLGVVVVDSRAIGTGSTCASTALLQYDIDLPLHDLAELIGLDRAVRSYHASADAVRNLLRIGERVGCELDQRPSIQVASKRSHVKALRREADLRKQHGFDVRFIPTEEEVRQCSPLIGPAALRSELGAQVDAWRLTHALHTRNTRSGAQVFAHSHVEHIDTSDTRPLLTTTRGHRIRAQYLIHAGGYETTDLLPRGTVALHSTYALVSEAGTLDQPWLDSALIWETAHPYLYMRSAPEGRIILGGRDESFRSPPLRDALLRKKTAALVKEFEERCAPLKLVPEFAWCGTFGETKDALPIIDQVRDDPRSFFALGMGGNGITFSLIAAEVIRDRILGHVHPAADLFTLDRW